jgi:valyl-tRNA synthetase
MILPLPEDLLKQELSRLTKEKEKLTLSLEKLRTQLANPEFANRAPAQLIEKQQQQLIQGERELEEIAGKLRSFQ